ncbi:hypothetical protein F4804DRAFT_331627 [Jackrogersella minutella]|nr:hypothetical protein F4804DRAFT_331627 [Jackrogersella minutella]
MAPPKQPETPETQAFTKDLERLYDNDDNKFFYKHMLRAVSDQLQQHRQGKLKDNTITLLNVKSQPVKIVLDPSEPTIWKDTRCNHGDRGEGPYIYYRTIQNMLCRRDMTSFDRRQAYLPLVVLFPQAPDHTHESDSPTGSGAPFAAAELRAVLRSERAEFEQSEHWAQLRAQLKAHRPALGKVDGVVAFACGTLTKGGKGCRKDKYATAQHALVLSLRAQLAKIKQQRGLRQGIRRALRGSAAAGSDAAVECCAQDPGYTAADEKVLKEEGVQVLRDPDGFVRVGRDSFVVSISPNSPVQQIIADLVCPAAIIQYQFEEMVNGPKAVYCGDPASSRVLRMIAEKYETVELKDHKYLRPIVMYIRREGK